MHLVELITRYVAEEAPVIFEPTATSNTWATTLPVYRTDKGNCDINCCAVYTRTSSGANVQLSSIRTYERETNRHPYTGTSNKQYPYIRRTQKQVSARTNISQIGAILRALVRFPMVSLEFFIDTILQTAVWSWGRLKLKRNEYQVYSLGVNAAGA
jgi:hypothetical protein